jgi:hypothetical protein
MTDRANRPGQKPLAKAAVVGPQTLSTIPRRGKRKIPIAQLPAKLARGVCGMREQGANAASRKKLGNQMIG